MHAVTVAGLGFALTFTVLARVEPADAGSGFEAIVGDISKRLKCEAAYRDLDSDAE